MIQESINNQARSLAELSPLAIYLAEPCPLAISLSGAIDKFYIKKVISGKFIIGMTKNETKLITAIDDKQMNGIPPYRKTYLHAIFY